jgi:Protein of unknown function (DUF3048) N-terminal domain/Protein of unknown function (DUF3048) C-terminal domain
MSPTRRGRVALGVATVLVLAGGAVGAVVFLGQRAGSGNVASSGPPPTTSSSPSSTPSPPPAVCPLTGVDPSDVTVPLRPALAVKVENLPAARPQTGLSWADIVYEEPVEGSITRFIVVYQCQDASRVEPVRSARLTDPDILVQLGKPLFAYAGGVPKVVTAIREAGLIDVNFNTPRASAYYHRDPNRSAPHDLYTSTHDLYAAAQGLYPAAAPDPIFTYTAKLDKGVGTKVKQVHVPFSSSSDVFWKWSSTHKVWLRYHGDVPHTLSDGTQVSAKNVIVQVVTVTLTDVTDVNGVHSPRVTSTGTGKCYVFRNGKVVQGTWVRKSLHDVTTFEDANGDEIPLAPGNTWIELLPTGIPVTII